MDKTRAAAGLGDKAVWGVISLMFAVIYLMNHFMPMMADDYRYAMNWDQTHHLESWREIFQFQARHYLEWGGRSLAHTIAQSMLFMGKPVFNVLNSMVFIVFLLLIYFHARGRLEKKIEPGLFILISFFCWFCLPTFGETVVWLVGSCNYLWMTTLVLAFLLPYRLAAAGRKPGGGYGAAAIMFIGGVFAGWTNENTGLMMTAAAAAATWYCYKEKKLRAWMLFGAAGAVVGYVLLAAAPGNYVRMATAETGDYSFVQNHIIDPLKTMSTLALHQSPIYITLAALWRGLAAQRRRLGRQAAAWRDENKEIIVSGIAYIAFSFLGQLAMFAAPTFPQRAGMGAAVFLMIGVLNLLRLPIYQDFILYKRQKLFCAALGCLWLVFAGYALYCYQTVAAEHAARLAYIEQCRAARVADVRLAPFSVKDRSALGMVVVNDIGTNPNIFRSVYYAKYFGVRSMARAR